MIITDRDTVRVHSEEVGILTATLEAAAEAVEIDLTLFQSVSVQIIGTFTGTLQFEVRNSPTGPWVAKSLISAAGASASSATAAGIWSGDIGSRYFRVRASALTIPGTGQPTVAIVASSDSQSNLSARAAVDIGAGTTGPSKAEDSAHASGDIGVYTLGVRAGAAPAVPTSAAADYGSFLITSEGKQIISTFGAEEHLWDACVDLTTTSDVAIIAAGAAGIRRVITDITLDNTGATPARVTIKDGTTRKYTRTVPANSSVDVQLKSPIRGTAATAVNGALTAAGTVTVSMSGYLGI